MAPLFAIIRYALLETFFCIPILPKTILCAPPAVKYFSREGFFKKNNIVKYKTVTSAGLVLPLFDHLPPLGIAPNRFGC